MTTSYESKALAFHYPHLNQTETDSLSHKPGDDIKTTLNLRVKISRISSNKNYLWPIRRTVSNYQLIQQNGLFIHQFPIIRCANSPLCHEPHRNRVEPTRGQSLRCSSPRWWSLPPQCPRVDPEFAAHSEPNEHHEPLSGWIKIRLRPMYSPFRGDWSLSSPSTGERFCSTFTKSIPIGKRRILVERWKRIDSGWSSSGWPGGWWRTTIHSPSWVQRVLDPGEGEKVQILKWNWK